MGFAAAGSDTTVVTRGDSEAFVVVSTAADELVLWSLLASITGGGDNWATGEEASLLDDEEAFVGRLGPDSMSGFGPVSPVFEESHGEA